jgi:hypothetical protein
MKKFVSTALIAAFASGSMFAAPAFATVDDVAVRLVASLNGSNVVDGGDPDGTGTFTAMVDIDSRRLCYDLVAENVPTIIFAHIHEGVPGDTGNPLVSIRVNDERCTSLSREDMEAIVANPSNYYVDVVAGYEHTDAIRGQLDNETTGSGG